MEYIGEKNVVEDGMKKYERQKICDDSQSLKLKMNIDIMEYIGEMNNVDDGGEKYER